MGADDWDDLRIFRAAATRASLSAAAELLGLHRSFVSRRVARLERHFGQRLFARTGRAVRLTEAGRAVLARADGMARLYDEARFGLRCPAAIPGEVRIAAAEGLAGWLLAPFADLFAAQGSRLVFLKAGARAEIALDFHPPSARARRIARLDYAVYASAAADPDPYFGPPWIEQGPPGSTLREWLEEAPVPCGWAAARAEDEGAALPLVRAGIGKTWLPVAMVRGEAGLVRRDPMLARRRDLWLSVAGWARDLDRVRRAADWVELVAKAAAEGAKAPRRLP